MSMKHTESMKHAGSMKHMGSMKHIGRRRGFGVACVAALTLPAMIWVGSVGLSYQSSTARRFTSTVWMSYMGLELGEAAIAEASHVLKPADLFDPQVFPAVAATEDPAPVLLKAMVADQLPADLIGRDYRVITDEAGAEACKMLVAFRFPARAARTVRVPGLARKLAAQNPGVLLDTPEDLAVQVRPLSFRREYYSAVHSWVNWGVVQFGVTVRTRELKGISAHHLRVDRRFTLKSGPAKGEEVLQVSSHNLRTFVVQEDR